MTKVLFLSRHSMSDEQLQDLKRIYGEDVTVKTVSEIVSHYTDVMAYGEGCDVFAVVLPPAILADLVNPRNNNKPVIRSVMNRVKTGNQTSTGEDEYRFVFDHWERVVKIEVVTERL